MKSFHEAFRDLALAFRQLLFDIRDAACIPFIRAATSCLYIIAGKGRAADYIRALWLIVVACMIAMIAMMMAGCAPAVNPGPVPAASIAPVKQAIAEPYPIEGIRAFIIAQPETFPNMCRNWLNTHAHRVPARPWPGKQRWINYMTAGDLNMDGRIDYLDFELYARAYPGGR